MFFLDANVFIEAMNRYYEYSICPGFWEWMNKECQRRNIASVDLVYDELKEDERFKTAFPNIKKLFLKVDDKETISNYREVVDYISSNKKYSQESKDKFFDGADPWLIAKTMTIEGSILVTHEQSVNDQSKKVKIPNVCSYFKVEYCNTFEMLKKMNARFVLDQQ